MRVVRLLLGLFSFLEDGMSEHRTAAEINEAATHVDRLRQRRDWLAQRIEAKKRVGWDIEYDTAERDALSWVLERLPPMPRV